MAGPGAHHSVRMQSGCQSLFAKIRFTSLEITFAKLFLHVSGDDERVAKVTLADRRSSRGGGAKVDLTPVALCEEFSAKYVTFILSNDDSVGLNPTRTNALKVLMRASCNQSYLPCVFLNIFFSRSVHFFEDKVRATTN